MYFLIKIKQLHFINKVKDILETVLKWRKEFIYNLYLFLKFHYKRSIYICVHNTEVILMGATLFNFYWNFLKTSKYRNTLHFYNDE